MTAWGGSGAGGVAPLRREVWHTDVQRELGWVGGPGREPANDVSAEESSRMEEVNGVQTKD